MKKKKSKNSEKATDKNKTNFMGFNEMFENNLKIYNNFLEQAKETSKEKTKNSTGIFNNNLEFYNNYLEQAKEFNKTNSDTKESNFTPQNLIDLISPTTDGIFKSFEKFSKKIHENPDIYFKNLNTWLSDIVKLNFYFISKTSNQEADPVIMPDKSDKRFSDNEWSGNLFFDFIKQFYLITNKFLENLAESVEFDDPKQGKLFKFYIHQLNMALSPSNFVFTNPEILAKTIEEGGQNLVRGMNNYSKDNLKHPNKFFISQTPSDDFEVGKNLATTEGKIIYKNDVFELIHYNSDGNQQFETPLLVVPPFINKYYIMDLNEKKSLVRYLINNKINTFLMSWKNPDSDSRDFGFIDYIEKGILKANEIICKETGSSKINLASYCIGGTLSSMTLAYLKNIKGENNINSATFFASLVDFEDFGDLQMFVSEDQIKSIEKEMKSVGYYDGRNLASSFNFLRPRDLYWNYVVNNYLLGKDPPSFDLLYWNSDSTNLAEKIYSDYLRSMCLNNNLVKNNYKLKGKILDLKKITTPMFHVGAIADHICPWKSVFSGLKYYGGKTKFVLSSSGHVAGIIQGKEVKPGKLYFYSSNKNNTKISPDEWLDSAKKYEGSWWPAWIKWLTSHSGDLKNVKALNLHKHPALYDAPGQYVVQKHT